MEKKILFPQIGGIMHGGDYNPEQWLDRPDILGEDIRMRKKSGMNCATLGVFSWSTYEPREGEFHFAWLHDIMDKLYANGIYTILATPSGERPAWLDETYPECRRVDSYGVREHHGAVLGDADHYGPAYGAAGGTLGTNLGSVAALIFVLFVFFAYMHVFKRRMKREKGVKVEPFAYTMKILIITIVPVLLSTTVYNISSIIDQSIFKNVALLQG